MLKTAGLAALKDFIGFLKKEKDFFALNAEKKAELVKHHFTTAYPDVFTTYLEKIDPDSFLREIKEALAVFDRMSYASDNNAFLNALAGYLSADFAYAFDQLSISFFFSPGSDRHKTLYELFPGESALHSALRELIFQSTSQELGMMANTSLAQLKNTPSVVIQTPVELEAGLRSLIRSHLLKEYPFSFPEFQVTPQIIGGMRIFCGGKVIDHSWMGRIQALAQLNFLKK